MAEITLNRLVNVCPRCTSKNIEEDEMWGGMDSTDSEGKDITVTLDFEGDDYFLCNFKCKECGTIFSIKRMNSQMD